MNQIQNKQDRYRYYLVLAYVRKVQKDCSNYIENLAIAFMNASTDSEKAKIKDELLIANKRCGTGEMNRHSRSRLNRAGLLNYWNELSEKKDTTDYYHPVQINSPEDAKKIIKQFPCISYDISDERKQRIIGFLTHLCDTYRKESDFHYKTRYFYIFKDYIENAQCLENIEKKHFETLFLKSQ